MSYKAGRGNGGGGRKYGLSSRYCDRPIDQYQDPPTLAVKSLAGEISQRKINYRQTIYMTVTNYSPVKQVSLFFTTNNNLINIILNLIF